VSYDLDVRSDAQYSKAVPLAEMTAIVGALPGITRVTPTFYVLERLADGIHVNIELANQSGEAARRPADRINSVGLLVPYPMLEKSGPLAIELALEIARTCGWSVYDPQSDREITRATLKDAIESQKSSGASARAVLARVTKEEGAGKEAAPRERSKKAMLIKWVAMLVVLAVLAVVALTLYRKSAARVFVSAGKGSFPAGSVIVDRIAVTSSVAGYSNEEVKAGAGKKFVSFDLHIKAPASSVDPDDFHLVKRKADKLGSEENVGNNAEDNYFFWTPVDASGKPAEALDPSAAEVRVRLSFQVPAEARNGYLFYWGEYVGPLEFD
jgi:hypothetical protein